MRLNTPHPNCRTITGHGYEILSDYQRSLLKLPTRGRPDGWIIDEILAREKYRLEAMFMPLIMAVEASESGFRKKCENPPFPLSGLSLEPGKRPGIMRGMVCRPERN
jgi:hypothetical protein